MTSLDDWHKSGWIVSKVPVWRSVTFSINGETLDAGVWVRTLSAGEYARIFRNGIAKDRDQAALIISGCVLIGENESPDTAVPLSYEDAYQLHLALSNALVELAGEVNGLTPPKN